MSHPIPTQDYNCRYCEQCEEECNCWKCYECNEELSKHDIEEHGGLCLSCLRVIQS